VSFLEVPWRRGTLASSSCPRTSSGTREA